MKTNTTKKIDRDLLKSDCCKSEVMAVDNEWRCQKCNMACDIFHQPDQTSDWREYKLCYVDCGTAYFTHQPLSEQWGDDWNDAPYEHNSGNPYESDGQKIVKLKFEGDFETPAERFSPNSPYSVQDINQGKVDWLKSSKWTHKSVNIPAGTAVREFVEKIESAGGLVYYPQSLLDQQEQRHQREMEKLKLAYKDVIDKTNDYTFVLAQREGVQKFDKSGVGKEPSPEVGLTIKQYINKYYDDRIKVAMKDEELAYKKLDQISQSIKEKL